MSKLKALVRQRFTVRGEIGDEMVVVCPHPDHSDHNPSASINVKKRVWVCYACGRGGRLEDLLDGNIADPDVDELLDELTSSLKVKESKTYPESWLDQFDGALHPYWLSRGLSEEVCREFRLGYDFSTGRATFPLRSPSGAVLGVTGRSIDNSQPRYQYPPGVKISETLFAYYKVRGGVRDVVLTEGALDAIAMWDVGVPAVAQMGANLSRTQIELMRRLGLRTITLAYDQDHAGRVAVERALTNPLLNFSNFRLMSWAPDEGKDPLDLPPDRRAMLYRDAQLVWGGG
jgi:DNA primase